MINEVNKDPLLIADLRDTGRQRSRGVIQLTKADELGKVNLPYLPLETLRSRGSPTRGPPRPLSATDNRQLQVQRMPLPGQCCILDVILWEQQVQHPERASRQQRFRGPCWSDLHATDFTKGLLWCRDWWRSSHSSSSWPK